jgi:hypothetical protein
MIKDASVREDCHDCILLIRAAGAASRHIRELEMKSRSSGLYQTHEPTSLVLARIKQAVEVAGGIRKEPTIKRKPPEPKNELLREGGSIGPLQLAVYRWAAFLLIGSCLGLLCALIWGAIFGESGGPRLC